MSGCLFPDGYLLQGIGLTTLATPEASLKRLFPLVDFLELLSRTHTSSHEWPLSPGSARRPPSHIAHTFPGDAGHFLCTKTLPIRLEGPSCAYPHRPHIGGLLHQLLGGPALAPIRSTCGFRENPSHSEQFTSLGT